MSDIETKSDDRPLKVHIKNNRAGEAVFRITQERYEAARARHPEVARRVETSIGWDLDDFEDRLREAIDLGEGDSLEAGTLRSESKAAQAGKEIKMSAARCMIRNRRRHKPGSWPGRDPWRRPAGFGSLAAP